MKNAKSEPEQIRPPWEQETNRSMAEEKQEPAFRCEVCPEAALQKAKELRFVSDQPEVRPVHDRIYGSIIGCPVWIRIENSGWVDCWPYNGQVWYDHGFASDEIWTACYRITNACEGLGPEAALETAKKLGFVPD